MPSRKIIFYTDCYVFGGCEKPIYEIISSDDFLIRYEYHLVYRDTDEYLSGMKADYPHIPIARIRGVKFPDINTWHLRIESGLPNQLFCSIAKNCASLAFRVLRPFIFLYEIIVLRSIFSKEKAHIAHINCGGYPGAWSSRAAVIAARCAGIKNIVLSVHNMACKTSGILDPLIDLFVRRSVSYAVSVSEASGSTLSSNRGFDRKRVINIYNGIKDIGNIKTASSGRRIAMVARFDERKGHGIAIHALKKVISDRPEFNDYEMVFLGDGPLVPSMKYLAEKEGLSRNIRFMGHRSDCLDYVASSLFLINPSTAYESLPYSILEAMALEVPAIGTDIGGISEEIVDGVTGIIIPPDDAAALAQAMLELLLNSERRRSMGMAARKRFCRHFTLGEMLGNYISLYDKMK